MITPYRINHLKCHLDSDEITGLYIFNNCIIVADYDDEFEYYKIMYMYTNNRFVKINNIVDETENNFCLKENPRPATKKELQDAGLWDFVINKEDFSSLEEQFDEYLRLGEEIATEKQKT
ncbi:MAG: hypothetical protein LBP41_00135 [Holosporaceae bacterium]|jgi:hypothetical protein|nr:hypothetical protein [Holosporaceae bacterium]